MSNTGGQKKMETDRYILNAKRKIKAMRQIINKEIGKNLIKYKRN
jgi:hypothetical protein